MPLCHRLNYSFVQTGEAHRILTTRGRVFDTTCGEPPQKGQMAYVGQ